MPQPRYTGVDVGGLARIEYHASPNDPKSARDFNGLTILETATSTGCAATTWRHWGLRGLAARACDKLRGGHDRPLEVGAPRL
jgi:hypothetical protein